MKKMLRLSVVRVERLIQFGLLIVVCLGAAIVDEEEMVLDLSSLGEGIYNLGNKSISQKSAYDGLDSSEWEDRNPEEMGIYIEGDIYQPFIPKNAVKFKSKKWQKATIPYVISDDFSPSEVQKIRNAFQIFQKKTCIRFVPRSKQLDYISIETSTSGCWSTVGRAGGKQVLNLQRNACIRRTGTILHELMHVLGFFHEHTRHDRDNYVSVNVRNIKPDSMGNFRKELQDRTTTHGIPYDLGSVMHYSSTAFSRNGNPTIEPKVKFAGKIGQRYGFSAKDIQIINIMYC